MSKRSKSATGKDKNIAQNLGNNENNNHETYPTTPDPERKIFLKI